jgi:hypothetical protein
LRNARDRKTELMRSQFFGAALALGNFLFDFKEAHCSRAETCMPWALWGLLLSRCRSESSG